MLQLENRAFGESTKAIKYSSGKVRHQAHHMEQDGESWMVY
jgi:hypothetical protein